MFQPPLAAGEGLLLVQGRESRAEAAIHMLFMRTDLTAVWTNADYEVVDVQIAHRWHPLVIPKKPAKYVLEIAPERFTEFEIGDRLRFETPNLD